MRLEDMKNNIPEMPDFIHEMIQNEVEKQLQNTKVIQMRHKKSRRWTGTRVAAAIAIFVLATSTMSYAGAKWYHMYLEKQGDYGITAKVNTEAIQANLDLPETVHGIDISAGYIPEGMGWIDYGYLAYPEHKYTGGISFSNVLLDYDDLDAVIQEKNVVDSEVRTFGDYEGVYIKYHEIVEEGSFNQKIYLICPDIYRAVEIYIGSDVTKEDAIKVVENLTITENDTIFKTAGEPTFSERLSPRPGFVKIGGESFKENKLPVYQIGDELEWKQHAQDANDEFIGDIDISACVDSVQVADDLQLIDQSKLPEEWVNVIGADGKLVDNRLSYIKFGDGINTLDEIVRIENVKQKLVYATVTYTNHSEVPIYHLCYLGHLKLMKHEDGKYQTYEPDEQSADDYDYIVWDGAADINEMDYYSVTDGYGNGGNYIPTLNPGESIQLNMAWIVNEPDLENMYLYLHAGRSMEETGVVDIRQ